MIGGDLGAFEISDVEYIRKILDDAERQMKNADAEMEYCDKKTQDILHDMELVEHTYHEKARLCQELTDIRRRRRIAKDTYDLVYPISQWRSEQGGPLAKLDNTIGRMRTIYEKQCNSVYYKRADDIGEMIPHNGWRHKKSSEK